MPPAKRQTKAAAMATLCDQHGEKLEALQSTVSEVQGQVAVISSDVSHLTGEVHTLRKVMLGNGDPSQSFSIKLTEIGCALATLTKAHEESERFKRRVGAWSLSAIATVLGVAVLYAFLWHERINEHVIAQGEQSPSSQAAESLR